MGTSIKLLTNFLAEILQAKRQWMIKLKVCKKITVNQEYNITTSAKLSFKIGGKIKAFPRLKNTHTQNKNDEGIHYHKNFPRRNSKGSP